MNDSCSADPTPTAAAGDESLRGRVAVVTGGAGGIGRATCWALATAGARIVVLDRDPDACHEAAEELTNRGVDALAVVADVSNEDDVEGASRATAAFGNCDILVNNAAILTWFGLEELELTEWERVLSINLTGAFLCMQRFGRQMLARRRGSIVNVASVAASSPEVGAGAYAPAKAGLAMMTRQAAVEWGPRGVRVNAVSPGVIDTGQASQFLQDATSVQRRKRMIPLGRFGDPREVARVISFLASDGASYVNGQNVEVDGGLMQMMLRVLPHPGVAEEI